MGFFNTCALVGHSGESTFGTFVSGTERSGDSFSNLGASTAGNWNCNFSLLYSIGENEGNAASQYTFAPFGSSDFRFSFLPSSSSCASTQPGILMIGVPNS